MATLTEQFRAQTAGELIKSKDWNGLIEAIDKLGDTLTTEITDLKNDLQPRVKALEDAEKQLRTDVDALKTEVDAIQPMIATLNRVIFTETRAKYAVGELAELIVTVTNLAGRPVTTMPTVHFVYAVGLPPSRAQLCLCRRRGRPVDLGTLQRCRRGARSPPFRAMPSI